MSSTPPAPVRLDGTQDHPTLGVLGAIEEEVRLIRDALTERSDETMFGVDVHRGLLDGYPIVLARSGVGKVNATMATVALARVGADALLFTGVAGATAPGLQIGDIVVAEDAVQHDIDVTALGNRPGELMGEPFSFACSPHMSELAMRACLQIATASSVVRGRIASGDQFIASTQKVAWIREHFDAHCAEMEGAAFAQAAYRMGRGAAIIRTISDTADGTAHMDFEAFLDMAAPRGLEIVRAFVKEWSES